MSSSWFPLPPGVSTAPTPPAITTNASPAPPNAVAAPGGFDPDAPNLTTLFSTTLPRGTAPVWPRQVGGVGVLPPYIERRIEAVPVRLVASGRAFPYALTVPRAAEALPVRVVVASPLKLTAEAGLFRAAGQAADLDLGFRLAADPGVLVMAGQAAELSSGVRLVADPGLFVVNGPAVVLQQATSLEAGVGLLGVAGQAVELFNGFRLIGEPGRFRLAGQVAILSSEETDPTFSSNTLLLPMDGANNSTTFTDISPLGLTVTASGGAKISTDQSQSGGASGYFNGTDSMLEIPANAGHRFGSGNFTVECHIRRDGSCVNSGIIGTMYDGEYVNFAISLDDAGSTHRLRGGVFDFPNRGGWTAITDTVDIPLDTWIHVCLMRSGDTLYLFKAGGVVGSVAFSGNTPDAVEPVRIGRGWDGSRWFNGYIDNVRIKKGEAIYSTSGFTPPPGPFPTS